MGQRIEHVDSIRAVAVLLMVMVHAAATWGPSPSSQPSILVYIVSGLGGLAAPLFVTVFGWGCFHSSSTPPQRYVRAGFLLLSQLAINVTAPHLFDVFTPGVLTLFAVLILIQPLWVSPFKNYQERKNMILWISISTTLIVVYFASGLQGSNQWDERIEVSTLAKWFSHLLLTGTYPLFPWLLFAILGSWIATQEKDGLTFPVTKGAVTSLLGGVLFCVVTLLYSEQNDIDWAKPKGDAILTFFPANAPFLIAALTGVAILWMLIQTVHSALLNPLGKLSLSVYLLHFIPIGLFHSIDENNDWSFEASLFAVLIYTLMWIPIAMLWLRLAPKVNAEYALRTLTKKLVKQ